MLGKKSNFYYVVALIAGLIPFIIVATVAISQQETSLIFGKSENGKMTWSNLSGSPADSVTDAGITSNLEYEITVVTGSSDSAGSCVLSYINTSTKQRITKVLSAGSKDTTTITGLRIAFNDTLTTGNRLRIKYTDKFEAKIDTVGGMFEAQWDSAYVDTVTTVSATPDTILLSRDYPQGLTVLADLDLQFTTNRITGWIFLTSGSNIFIPIRHSTSDTFFVKSATIPDMVLMRGK